MQNKVSEAFESKKGMDLLLIVIAGQPIYTLVAGFKARFRILGSFFVIGMGVNLFPTQTQIRVQDNK